MGGDSHNCDLVAYASLTPVRPFKYLLSLIRQSYLLENLFKWIKAFSLEELNLWPHNHFLILISTSMEWQWLTWVCNADLLKY